MDWNKQTVHQLFTSKRSLVKQGETVSNVLLSYFLQQENLSDAAAARLLVLKEGGARTIRRG